MFPPLPEASGESASSVSTSNQPPNLLTSNMCVGFLNLVNPLFVSENTEKINLAHFLGLGVGVLTLTVMYFVVRIPISP